MILLATHVIDPRQLDRVFVTTYGTHFDVGGLGFATAVFIGHRP